MSFNPVKKHMHKIVKYKVEETDKTKTKRKRFKKLRFYEEKGE